MRNTIAITLSVLLLGGLAYAKPPHAEDNGKGKKEKHHKKGKHKFQKKSQESFSSAERYTVQSYYRNLPPGLQKKYKRTGKLPPGWENKVGVGQQLPLEYRKELRPLPKELHDTIEVGPVGTEVKRIGDKIIRLEQATNMILDVFEL